MNYGYGKTFHLKDGFTALNGCIQYYKITFGDGVKLALTEEEKKEIKDLTLADVVVAQQAQANYLRVLETLRTYGGQPIITKVAEKEIEFTLEQPNVYGKNEPQQVSAKYAENGAVDGVTEEKFHFQAEAVEKIVELFSNVKTVALAVNTDEGYKPADKADGVDLTKAIIEDKENAGSFGVTAKNVEVKEVLF